MTARRNALFTLAAVAVTILATVALLHWAGR